MDRRTEIVEAAIRGIREYLNTIRGAHACGKTEINIGPSQKQFDVVFSDGITIGFDTIEY